MTDVKASSAGTVTARRTSSSAASASVGVWSASVTQAGTAATVRYPAADNYPSESLYPSLG